MSPLLADDEVEGNVTVVVTTGDTHVPELHESPAAQAFPQPPQFARLELVSVSQPGVAAPSQSAKLPLQA
jgi:hypothetical protein